jgi:hypothetical protein
MILFGQFKAIPLSPNFVLAVGMALWLKSIAQILNMIGTRGLSCPDIWFRAFSKENGAKLSPWANG